MADDGLEALDALEKENKEFNKVWMYFGLLSHATGTDSKPFLQDAEIDR
jgi:hypothetical protein